MSTVIHHLPPTTQAFHHEQNPTNDPSPPSSAKPVAHLSEFVSPPATVHGRLDVFHTQQKCTLRTDIHILSISILFTDT